MQLADGGRQGRPGEGGAGDEGGKLWLLELWPPQVLVVDRSDRGITEIIFFCFVSRFSSSLLTFTSSNSQQQQKIIMASFKTKSSQTYYFHIALWLDMHRFQTKTTELKSMTGFTHCKGCLTPHFFLSFVVIRVGSTPNFYKSFGTRGKKFSSKNLHFGPGGSMQF